MLLSVNELMSRDLKGFMYNELTDGYTMTGWGTIDNYYIVLEDNGEKCIVAERDNRTRTKTLSKKTVAYNINRGTICEWDSELKAYINKIEKL